MPLKVTESASAMLMVILDSTEHDSDEVIRLVSDSLGNLSVGLDAEIKDDQIVKHKGTTVMVIQSSISTDLSDNTLDVVETPEGFCLTLFDPRLDDGGIGIHSSGDIRWN